MSKPRKRLGFDTDLWALVELDGQIKAGDRRPRIYWTKNAAKSDQRVAFRDCQLVRVRVVEVSESES